MPPQLNELINILLAILLFLFCIFLFRSIKRKYLIRKRLEEYTNLLKQALEARRMFYSLMENAKLSLAKLNATRNELMDGRSRLDDYRAELREKLLVIRGELKNGHITPLDEKHIQQLRIQFSQHWSLFNSLKKDYNDSFNQLPVLQDVYNKASEQEQQAYQQWIQNKSIVFQTYNEINKYTRIENPGDFFQKDREGHSDLNC